MMIVDFDPLHAELIVPQPLQAFEIGATSARELASGGPAATLVVDSRVVMCGGIVRQWEGRWILWSLLSADAGKYMVRATRYAQRLIDWRRGDRVEAIVRSDFPQARRWAELVGLKWHHHEEKFLPGGFDAEIFVRL